MAEKSDLGKIDFSTFVLSLATSAQIHLGMLGEKASAPPSLPEAQQVIDILDLLVDKTAGNRTEEESNLLQQVLYELRVAFVEKSKKR